MMKLSDYVVQFFVERGVCDIFLVSGGGIMHLLDSVGLNPGMRYYCNYHEQACAISAEGYARATGRPGLCLGTTGPGAVNAVSGILGAWVDSLPLVVLAGQVRTDIMADYGKIRQIGPQEANSAGMARPVSKHATTVRDPRRIRYELEYAYWQATSGRPGPVLLELPLDVQGATIDETTLEGFTPEAAADAKPVRASAAEVIEAIAGARRPLFIAGNGISSSGTREVFHQLLERTGIPAVVPLTAKDLVWETHPQYAGLFGGAGQRRANFAVQNCDCLIALGAGLNLQKVGFNVAGFAPKARKVLVDVDAAQLCHQPVKADLPVLADLREFLPELLRQLDGRSLAPDRRWLEACAHWKARYPILTPDYAEDSEHVNTYLLADALAEALGPGAQILTGNGIDVASIYQAFRVKPGQRVYISGWGSMGWDLPLSVGACIGSGKKPTVCMTGDGSMQWNVQELLTIRQYDLPIKIFVCNNRGYAAIRATQRNFFAGRYVASDASSGVANPDFRLLAAAYGIPYLTIQKNAELATGVAKVLEPDGPVICEVNVSLAQSVSPRVSSARREDGTYESRPLEDMAPFLPREEVWENMHLLDGGDS